jgi:hypothetical protein
MLKSTRTRWAGHVERIGKKMGWEGKKEGKKPVGKPRCRWETNIKMNPKEIQDGVA